MLEEVSSETLILVYQITRRHVQEYCAAVTIASRLRKAEQPSKCCGYVVLRYAL